jgi:hypothetical protein
MNAQDSTINGYSEVWCLPVIQHQELVATFDYIELDQIHEQYVITDLMDLHVVVVAIAVVEAHLRPVGDIFSNGQYEHQFKL